jgi:hypothetical protein
LQDGYTIRQLLFHQRRSLERRGLPHCYPCSAGDWF